MQAPVGKGASNTGAGSAVPMQAPPTESVAHCLQAHAYSQSHIAAVVSPQAPSGKGASKGDDTRQPEAPRAERVAHRRPTDRATQSRTTADLSPQAPSEQGANDVVHDLTREAPRE